MRVVLYALAYVTVMVAFADFADDQPLIVGAVMATALTVSSAVLVAAVVARSVSVQEDTP